MVSLGALVFGVAGHFRCFPLMCLGDHITGMGVATLERAANPYCQNVGPVLHRSIRLLFGQSTAAAGTVIAPEIANLVLYSNQTSSQNGGTCVFGKGWPLSTVEADTDLGPTISLYFYTSGAGLFLALVYALIFFRTTLVPEIPQSEPPKANCGWRFWKHPICNRKNIRLWLGCFVNFFNLGNQVAVAQFIIPTLEYLACLTTKEATTMFRNAQTLFLVGRIVAFALVTIGVTERVRNSVFSIFFQSRVVLWTWMAGAIILAAVTATLTGNRVVWITACIMLLEAPSFPMIFEAATVGLGEYATLGETFMVTSISGGMFGAPLFGIIRDNFNISKAWWQVVAFFSIVLIFPTLANLVPSWRLAIDQKDQEAVSDPEQINLPDMPKKMADLNGRGAKKDHEVHRNGSEVE